MGDGRHTMYGSFMENFESYRKLKCILETDAIQFNTEKTQTMKIYNPYKVDIPLDKLRFGIAYMNDYKEVRDVLKMKASPSEKTISTLKSNDTVSFTFRLPETDMKKPGYFKIGISENELPFGLNGESIKLK
jgi:LEA14-like dessication related protein